MCPWQFILIPQISKVHISNCDHNNYCNYIVNHIANEKLFICKSLTVFSERLSFNFLFIIIASWRIAKPISIEIKYFTFIVQSMLPRTQHAQYGCDYQPDEILLYLLKFQYKRTTIIKKVLELKL